MDPTAKGIQKALIMGGFRLSFHTMERSALRAVTEDDIRNCGRTAKSIKLQENHGTWRVIGRDCDGETLNVIRALHDQLLIVTVY